MYTQSPGLTRGESAGRRTPVPDVADTKVLRAPTLSSECRTLLHYLGLQLTEAMMTDEAAAKINTASGTFRQIDPTLAEVIKLEVLKMAYEKMIGDPYGTVRKSKFEDKENGEGKAQKPKNKKESQELARSIRKDEILLVDRTEVAMLPANTGKEAAEKDDNQNKEDKVKKRTVPAVAEELREVKFYRLASGEGWINDLRSTPEKSCIEIVETRPPQMLRRVGRTPGQEVDAVTSEAKTYHWAKIVTPPENLAMVWDGPSTFENQMVRSPAWEVRYLQKREANEGSGIQTNGDLSSSLIDANSNVECVLFLSYLLLF